MDSRTRDRLRGVLNARREEVQAMLSRVQEELRAAPTAHADAADQAVASYDKNALHQQAEQANRQLKLLDDALLRINSGDYGQCTMCGKDIAIARLEALPWARYCVDCQEIQEGMQRR